MARGVIMNAGQLLMMPSDLYGAIAIGYENNHSQRINFKIPAREALTPVLLSEG